VLGANSGPLGITQADRVPGFLKGAPRDLVKAGAYLANSVVTLPAPHRLHVFLGTAAVIQFLLFGLLAVNSVRRRILSEPRWHGLAAATVWGFVCGCSWIVLMPGHMRPHVYFATIVFYVPWLTALYVVSGEVVTKGLHPVTRALAAAGPRRAVFPSPAERGEGSER
jgi:peptidoglycan/LPS O-acetylase OafA/YrhL